MAYEVQVRFNNRTEWGFKIPDYEYGRAAERMLLSDEEKEPEELKVRTRPSTSSTDNRAAKANARPSTDKLRGTLKSGNEKESRTRQQLLTNIEEARRSSLKENKAVEYRAPSLSLHNLNPTGSSIEDIIKIESDEEGKDIRGTEKPVSKERERPVEGEKEAHRKGEIEKRRRNEGNENDEGRREGERGRLEERGERRNEDESPQKRRRYNDEGRREGERGHRDEGRRGGDRDYHRVERRRDGERDYERDQRRREGESSHQREERRREEALRRERTRLRSPSEEGECTPPRRDTPYTPRGGSGYFAGGDRRRQDVGISLRHLRNLKEAREARELEMERSVRQCGPLRRDRSRSRPSEGHRRHNDLTNDREERPSMASIGFWRRMGQELRRIPHLDLRAPEDEGIEEEEVIAEGHPITDSDTTPINWRNFPNSRSIVESNVFSPHAEGPRAQEVQNHLWATIAQEVTRRHHWGITLESQHSILTEEAAICLWQLMGQYLIKNDDEYHARMTMDRIIDFLYDLTRWWSIEDIMHLLNMEREWHYRELRSDAKTVNWRRPWNLFQIRCVGKVPCNHGEVRNLEVIYREYSAYLQRRQAQSQRGWENPTDYNTVTRLFMPPFTDREEAPGLGEEYYEAHRFDKIVTRETEGNLEQAPLLKGGPNRGKDWNIQEQPTISERERERLEHDWRRGILKRREKKERTEEEKLDEAWKKGANLMALNKKSSTTEEGKQVTAVTTHLQTPTIPQAASHEQQKAEWKKTLDRREAARAQREKEAAEKQSRRTASQAVITTQAAGDAAASSEEKEGAITGTAITPVEGEEEASAKATRGTSAEGGEGAPKGTVMATPKDGRKGTLVGVKLRKSHPKEKGDGNVREGGIEAPAAASQALAAQEGKEAEEKEAPTTAGKASTSSRAERRLNNKEEEKAKKKETKKKKTEQKQGKETRGEEPPTDGHPSGATTESEEEPLHNQLAALVLSGESPDPKDHEVTEERHKELEEQARGEAEANVESLGSGGKAEKRREDSDEAPTTRKHKRAIPIGLIDPGTGLSERYLLNHNTTRRIQRETLRAVVCHLRTFNWTFLPLEGRWALQLSDSSTGCTTG
eukprot:GHVU01223690.1.p1 GENE.GHVU01223690.1~~GHVU01223690.1.p1  ORF type:complete len:1178 (+),score=259.06 GHVU01223690.1:236-3535(+)